MKNILDRFFLIDDCRISLKLLPLVLRADVHFLHIARSYGKEEWEACRAVT